MSTVIKIENVSKQYKLGSIGTNTLKGDLQRWWYNMRGLPDPTLMIGQENSLRKVNSNNEINYEYVWALKDINFEVQQGEVLGIIGKNGAGKSTLLKLLSRVTAPTTGSIKVKGRIASLLEVGTGFHPELTGIENIFLNGAILGMTKSEIQNKLEEIIDFAGIAKYIDTPVKRYSSGMYVRLAFAVAAHLEPEILIVDEVLAVGDAEFQKKALGKMQAVSRNEGRTVLFVSHNMQAVATLTNKAILLKNGNIVHEGKTSDVVGEYINVNKSSDLVYISNRDYSEPHIVSVKLETSYSKNCQLNGDTMNVFIEIFTPTPIKGACFSFQFVDSKERNFTHLWVFDNDIPYCREKGKYQLKCTMKNLRLYMGQYYLKCYFSEPPGGRFFEILENICPFEVVMHKTTRTNFQWYPEACAYIEDGGWEIKKI